MDDPTEDVCVASGRHFGKKVTTLDLASIGDAGRVDTVPSRSIA